MPRCPYLQKQQGKTRRERQKRLTFARNKQICLPVKRFKNILLAALIAPVALVGGQAYAQGKTQGTEPLQKPKNLATQATVYIFGVADSMRDSTVYITPIQRIDSANLQNKTKFLLDRPFFSSQLKTYFSSTLNDPNRLCIVYYTTGNERKALKRLQRVRKNYLNEGALLRQLSPEEFKFEPVVGAIYESVGSDEAPAVVEPEQ